MDVLHISKVEVVHESVTKKTKTEQGHIIMKHSPHEVSLLPFHPLNVKYRHLHSNEATVYIAGTQWPITSQAITIETLRNIMIIISLNFSSISAKESLNLQFTLFTFSALL